jgi:hypothetical protein
MKLNKLIIITLMSQLSVACMATPYEPTKLQKTPKGVAPPKSSPTDDLQVPSCNHKFTNEQSLEEVANLAALMQQDCGLRTEQVFALAQKVFTLK